MNSSQLMKFIKRLVTPSQKELVIRIHSSNFKKSLSRSKQLVEKIERNMRIKKLELALREMNLNRSWV